MCVPVHPRSGSHAPHRDSRIIRPLPHEARPASPAGLRITVSRHRSLLLWELRSGWAGTGTGHPSAFLKRFGKAKPRMKFRPIREAPLGRGHVFFVRGPVFRLFQDISQKRSSEKLRSASGGSLPGRRSLPVVPGSPESPRLEGDPSALPMGEPGQVPGGRGIRVTSAPPEPRTHTDRTRPTFNGNASYLRP